jgi:uncharacterized protein
MSAYLAAMCSAAFTAGVLGSAHCVAMCGGIAGALCRGGGAGRLNPLAYQSGRILSYVAAGAAAGFAGGAAWLLKGDARGGHALLYGAGLALIMMALYIAGWTPLVKRIDRAGSVIWKHVQPLSRGLIPADSLPKALGLGLIWGWLPCGMVYSALLVAAAMADPAEGALVMLAFGAGTLPSMLAVSVFALRLPSLRALKPARMAASALILLTGVFAIVTAAHPATFGVEGLLCLVPLRW